MSMRSALSKLGSVTGPTRDKAEEIWEAAHKAGFTMTRLWGMGPGDEHGVGRALDFMITGSAGGKRAGDWIADYLWDDRKRLDVKWIIWDRHIRSTSPGKSGNWEDYNGSNPHTDHVHVFFATGAYVPPKGSGGGGGGEKPPKAETWHVSLDKVSTWLWGLKHGTEKNIMALPGRDIEIVDWREKNGRTWGVTASDNWFAKDFLAKGGKANPPAPKVSLSSLREAARKDPDRKQGGVTSHAKDDVLIVEAALLINDFMDEKYVGDGSFGSVTVKAYSKWQESLGYRGKDADGIPGRASLEKLLEPLGYKVVDGRA